MIPQVKNSAKLSPFTLIIGGISGSVISIHLMCLNKLTQYRHLLNDKRHECLKILPDGTVCPTYYITVLSRGIYDKNQSDELDENCKVNEIARIKLQDSILFWSTLVLSTKYYRKEVEWMNSEIKTRYIDA